MIQYDPNFALTGHRVWYVMEKGELYVPAVVMHQEGPQVLIKCLTRPLMPRLDLSLQEDQMRLAWRQGRLPGESKHVRSTYPALNSKRSSGTKSFI